MQVGVHPLQIDYLHPLSPDMAFRGGKTEGFYSGMVDVASTRKSVYGQPVRSAGEGSGATSPRLASMGSEAIESTLFHQTSSDIAATLAKRGAWVERLAAVGDGGNSFGQLHPGPPAEAFHDANTLCHNWGYNMARRQDAEEDPTVVAFTNQAASTPGRHGVPFGKRGPAAGPPAPQRASRGFNQSAGGSEAAALPGLPGVDAPHQEWSAFSMKHKVCFAFAFQGACPREECLFNHDPARMPAGYFKAHATKKRSARVGSREVSRPKRRLYALSTEQADVVAAYFNEDVEAVGGEEVDGLPA